MKKLVRETIVSYDLINKFDKVVIGVSGGHDSMTLLYVLESLKKELEFDIVVAHINHGVRGEESDGDEEYVREISKKLNLPFHSCKVSMEEYAKTHKMTSEEAGREIRYDFFKKILERESATKIAVAHNKNDQAETLIMRFMRGTGIDGLRGMEYKSNNIIRPLLGVERSIIEEYCEELNLEPRIDKTNFMPIYGRNKVRLELIPFIEDTFNSGIINTLFRTSEIMKTDSDFLIQHTAGVLDDLIKSDNGFKIKLDILKLRELHQAVVSRVIRHALEKINMNLKGIERKHIEDIVKLIESQKTGIGIDITNNIVVKVSYDDLILEKGEVLKTKSYNHKMAIGSVTDIPELNSQMKSYVCSISDAYIDFNNSLVKCFDYDNIKSKIYVRNRRNGDKFIPIGMNGHKKLKDFFIDQKVPKEDRDSLPIVVDGEEIVWVVGLRISEKYKVNSNTKNVLVLEYIK